MDTLKDLPQPFGFYRYILKSDHLHFGFWPDENSGLSMEDAQQRMFDHLLSFFPPFAASVLDVGCGLGYSAFLLAEKGYKVTAIAPSRELIEYARLKYGDSGVDFEVLGFFDEDGTVFSAGRYDVVFFQESVQYMSPLDAVISKARTILKEKGLIIIGDEVCNDKSLKSQTAVHVAADFTVALSENGFNITEHEKIGKNVKPTCEFIIREFTDNFTRISSSLPGEQSGEKLSLYLEGWKKQKEWYRSGQFGYEIFVAKKDSFFIRPYREGDEHNILTMFTEVFKVNRTLDHWYWKFRDNPYGSHKISEAFSEDNKFVAHYTGYPVPFYCAVDGVRNFLSYQIGDTMTSPGVRNIGLGKTGLLARTANHFYAKFCKGNVPFIYGFNAGHIRKLGMRYLGYSYIDPVGFWVKDVLKSPFKKLPMIGRIFAGYSVEEVQSVSDEWSDFFGQVCGEYKFLVCRDAEYLRWRYLNCPDGVHRIFAVRKRGRLVGWGVFTQKERKIIWGDALFDRRFPEAAGYLLQALFKQEFAGGESIEGWFSKHPDWWNHELQKLGFTLITEPNDLTPGFVTFDEPSIIDTLQNYFYYTIGDSDLF